jgi:hypothetical protein
MRCQALPEIDGAQPATRGAGGHITPKERLDMLRWKVDDPWAESDLPPPLTLMCLSFRDTVIAHTAGIYF